MADAISPELNFCSPGLPEYIDRLNATTPQAPGWKAGDVKFGPELNVDKKEPAPSTQRKANGWAAVARFGGIGDNLMCASPLKALRAKHGHVEVISSTPQSVVFENNPHIDKLSVVDKTFIPQDNSGNWQNYFVGRAQEYDAFFHLSHSCETLRALFVGQTQFHWPATFRRKMCGQSYLETVHDVCEVPYEFGPLFFATEAEVDHAKATKQLVGEKMIVWVISGTRLDKIHPYASVIIAQLIREVGPVVMLGAPGRDFESAKLIEQDVERFNGSKTGLHLGLSPDPNKPTWDIRRVLSFAQQGEIVIGPDTGPMWAVAFEQNKKVMLLSHASVENITKGWVNTTSLHADGERVSCWPCHQLHDTVKTCRPNAANNGAACISDIGVQTIVRTVAELW